MTRKKIAILGGGNIGISIAEGLIKNDFIAPGYITVTRRKKRLIEHLTDKGIVVTDNNVEAVRNADIVITAVQPKQLSDLLIEIKNHLDPEHHILASVVTGVSIQEIKDVIGADVPIFRVMPNTAIAIQESMTCIATNNGNEPDTQIIEDIFNRLGKTVIVEEDLMASSTVLGACGIAYSLRFIRAASQGGIEIGFDSDVAQLIAAQTVKGAASLLLEHSNHPEEEIDKVTTPRGCTIAGLNEMEHQGFSSALIKGVITSFKRISNITE
ncbi:MAG TPA: pyrroline-5-carboxylate reductase [Balneolales bacterium]|nr:pyrroline-5-carboxylate reductase [Balneolales bacterium]